MYSSSKINYKRENTKKKKKKGKYQFFTHYILIFKISHLDSASNTFYSDQVNFHNYISVLLLKL